jgi:hypothetical protein
MQGTTKHELGDFTGKTIKSIFLYEVEEDEGPLNPDADGRSVHPMRLLVVHAPHLRRTWRHSTTPQTPEM